MIPGLKPNDSIKAVYSRPFLLTYVVAVTDRYLSTNIHVDNLHEKEVLEFQALLHTYIRAPADEAKITGLKDLPYYDKTESTHEARETPKIETREEVTVSKYTDSVYETDRPCESFYTISWPDGFINIAARDFDHLVVWNPQEEGRKLEDMEPDGW
jgi:glucose-6-phosphate 1-epimerase